MVLTWPVAEMARARLDDIWENIVGADSSLHLRVDPQSKLSSNAWQEQSKRFERQRYERDPLTVPKLRHGACYKINGLHNFALANLAGNTWTMYHCVAYTWNPTTSENDLHCTYMVENDSLRAGANRSGSMGQDIPSKEGTESTVQITDLKNSKRCFGELMLSNDTLGRFMKFS
ncbi:unnamed protein product [Gongylonema pulchrum]|uniref:Dep-1 fifth Fn3-like domain-containing protein n=1 Tax=Gongylonema pulchrum TaxID=637853 RepID=A0A3P7PQZ5_9BILA|nr:unnamed protein product [Gongylonema pulchrum]